MNIRYAKSLFIFRRDLRLEDNTGLNFALKSSEHVIPAFIFTPAQIDENSYRGDPCLQFMLESLEELETSLRHKHGKLYLFLGNPEEIVSECIRRNKIDAVIVNKDYTPYSLDRDRKIEEACQQRGVAFHSLDDVLLHPPEKTCKDNGKPYTVFTPFFKNASQIVVSSPSNIQEGKYFREELSLSVDPSIFVKILPHRRAQLSGGRSNALDILRRISQFDDYSSTRDFPAIDATTHLSPHMKFTTVSPREVYAAIVRSLGKRSDLIRSLYWRDFFTSIGYFFPRVFSGSFHEKFDQIVWKNNEADFRRWCEGRTGFPIVDAGMRQLHASGLMHNRVRMIVASFLVKDLHIDWRWGEKFFARSLIDYDPAVNNGNWQWAASTGCDAQPYFRIFNPWLQQKKFDPDCVYIKHWIPELENFSSEAIHSAYLKKISSKGLTYPSPMLDHSIESKQALDLYKKCMH